MKSILVTFFCFAIVNVAVAMDAVIWRQELSSDSNSECRPGAMVVDNKSNEVIILGTSTQLDAKKSDFQLWKIDPNGSVKHKKSLGPSSKRNSLMAGPFGIKASVKPDTGDIVRLNMFDDDDANGISLSITNRNMQSRSAKLGVRRKRSETFLLHDMTSYQNNNLLFVGQESLNGIVMKTDLSGNVLWKKTFDRGQVDILSSVACAPDGNDFYVVGLSTSMSGKMTFAGPATICVLHYDGNGELKASDFFEGGIAPWPSSLPKVICLPFGIVMVVYDKSRNGKTTELYVKAYSPELEPLYEKQILKTKEDGPPAYFDICVASKDRFVLAGKINHKDLRLYECKADGAILQTLELDGEVGAGGVYVEYLSGKIFVAFATRSQKNIKGTKIELLALKPYKTN